MNKKLEVIKRVTKRQCNFCQDKNNDCKVCNGSGIHKDYSYIMIVGKYAYSGDTLK